MVSFFKLAMPFFEVLLYLFRRCHSEERSGILALFKISYLFSRCHSEEQSDEESWRYSQFQVKDPSLTLRMTRATEQ